MAGKLWTRCYEDGWQDLIVPEAFSHPAKMARGLLVRILDHIKLKGWKADVILDPFGGIGSTGLLGAYGGYHVVCVELEERFVLLAEQNFALHRNAWRKLGCPDPVIIQGDSRRLCEIVDSADIVVSSPPFSTPGCQPAGNMPSTPIRSKIKAMGLEKKAGKEYGHSPGQLGQEQGETFWQAAKEILIQCHKILRPGGHAIFVCKDFVRKGKRVPFSDDWQKLCEAVGFKLVCRHKAMLLKETKHKSLFGHNIINRKKDASFFRRLIETKYALKKYWNTLSDKQKAKYIIKAATIRKSIKSKHQLKPTPEQLAFVESGEDEYDWNEEIRIDHEDVICMIK